jgi:choline monooxygenase
MSDVLKDIDRLPNIHVPGGVDSLPLPVHNILNGMGGWKEMINDNPEILGLIEKLWIADIIGFEWYKYSNTVTCECHYDLVQFMEAFGDNYHVEPFHPWLWAMLDVNGMTWHAWDDSYFQIVPSKASTQVSTTETYRQYRNQILRYTWWKLPTVWAIWFAKYPNITIEHYPFTIVISKIHQISPGRSLNVIYFFYDNRVDRAFIDAEYAAYMETVKEDDEIARRMYTWRQALGGTNTWEKQVYHPLMEQWVEHFHKWYHLQV